MKMKTVLLLSLLAVTTADPLLVNLPAGAVQGFKLNQYHAFRGIPYAAPPTGNRRWVPPQPVVPWKPTVLSATEFKPNCLQPSPPCWYSIRDVKKSSEDCLYVDVYVPDVDDLQGSDTLAAIKKPKAVLVWIHGGDYQYGGSNDRETMHPPRYPHLANTIYVSLNYRLSVFGYLGSEHLRSRDVTTPKSTGNYGAQDQRAAIKWVHDHIALFGGDPSRVTIFGESAGAGSVTVQTVMPRSFGLFTGAITESGGFSQWVAKEMDRAEDNYAWVMSNLDLKPDEVERLVGMPAHEVLNAAQYWMPGCPWPDTMVQSQFAPTIDGVELIDQPSKLAAAGMVAPNVSVIFGSNRDEGTMFVSDNNYTHRQGHYSGANLPHDISQNQFYDFSYGSWGAIVGRMIEKENVYPLSCKRPELEYERCPIGTYNTWWWAATRATGDFMMTCTARRAAMQWTSFGHDAYNYYFSHTPIFSVNTYPTPPWGAFHGSEVPFVWDARFELTGPAEMELAKTMVRYWSNFAKTANPNLPSGTPLPTWPKLIGDEKVDGMIRLATKKWMPYESSFEFSNVSAVEGLRKAECDFWDTVEGYVVDPIALSSAASKGSSSSGSGSGDGVDDDDMNSTITAASARRKYQKEAVMPPADLIASDVHWRVLSRKVTMPTPRTLFGMVSLPGHVLTVGGLAATNSGDGSQGNSVHVDSGAVEMFDVSSRQWSQGPSLSFPRSGLAVVSMRGVGGHSRVLAVGGMYGEKDATDFYAVPYVEMMNVKPNGEMDKSWTRLPNLPANRTESAVVFCQGRVYVIGGAGATIASATESMWSLRVMRKGGKKLLIPSSQAKETWRKEADLPTLRSSLAAEVVNGQIVVAGGMRGFLSTTLDADPMKTVDVFDPTTGKWVAESSKFSPHHLPQARHSPASAVVPVSMLSPPKARGRRTTEEERSEKSGAAATMMLLGGGYGTKGDLRTTIGLAEGSEGTWMKLPMLNVPRMGLRMAYSGASGCVYAMGGMTMDPEHHDVAGSYSPITGVVEELCPASVEREEL